MRQSETGRGCPEVPGRGGGNGQEILAGILDQQGENEMREQPAAGERLALGGQAAKAKQPFEPPEREFHLPPEPLRREHLGRRHRGR